MCIIIDTNTLASVFKTRSADHREFAPVLNWVINGRGMLIYGGSTYLREIEGYLDIFSELSKMRKAINIDIEKVNDKEDWAAAQIQHPDYDDPHIVALLMVSGCKLVCTKDHRSVPYLTHRLFFPRASKRPRIYSRRRNANLLVDENLTSLCRPGIKLSSTQKKGLAL